MKKLITFFICGLFCFLIFCACGKTPQSSVNYKAKEGVGNEQTREEDLFVHEEYTSRTFYYFYKPTAPTEKTNTPDSGPKYSVIGGECITRAPETTATSKQTVSTRTTVYTAKPKNPETISEEKQKKICKDFLQVCKKNHAKATGVSEKDIKISLYLGTYNGHEIVQVSCLPGHYHDGVYTQTIAGYRFEFSNNQPILVYTGGEFMELSNAFDKRIVSQTDLHDIWYYWNER